MRDYRPSSPAPVKMEETVVKTEPMATIRVEEEWLDSSQRELCHNPPLYPSQAELRRLAGELLNGIGEMRESESPQPRPPSTLVTPPKGGGDAALAPMGKPHTPAAESSANPWEAWTWTSPLSVLDDLTRPSVKWLTQVDDMEWLEQDCKIVLNGQMFFTVGLSTVLGARSSETSAKAIPHAGNPTGLTLGSSSSSGHLRITLGSKFPRSSKCPGWSP